MKNYKINRDDTLFVFLDLQDSLLKAIENRDEILKNSVILAKTAEILNIDSIITLQYPKGLGGVNEEIHEFIKNAPQIDKAYFSCMRDEKFLEEIKKFGKRQVVIAGIEAHICVFQTARDMVDSDLNVFILSDAVGSRNKKNRENALRQLNDLGCVVTNIESILFDLCEVSGTPEFKKVQKLII